MFLFSVAKPVGGLPLQLNAPIEVFVHYDELNVASPVAHALKLLGYNWASALVATGVIAGLTTVMLVLYYGLTRIIFAMARDGLLPEFFNNLHKN